MPVRISLGLLRREMASAKASRFLIDGFPRNFDNVQVRNGDGKPKRSCGIVSSVRQLGRRDDTPFHARP